MELLRSSIGANIEENVKRKMIKEICSLLQFIDINLQWDSFCSQSIVEYAEKTIKNRYTHCLRDVICKIYNQMEFDLFDDDGVEASDSLPNSNNEDLQRDNKQNYEIHDSTTGAPCFAVAQQEKYPQEKIDNTHERRLIEAQERRDRNRRLSSFTSWMPDLQRVWALKRPKAEKVMHDRLQKPSKRRKRLAGTNDRVCETPVTGRKEHSRDQENASFSGISNCNPLSKALFHNDG
ncbi:hypothetical protein Cni_G10868 [Canna indica]|uniref:Uncharacterized protein n=1 Tax=Canna indica TaxID=4628 RepID=A0AAQ3K6N0_9LILI|nr:hypothetical protein Cni_G10868 [Canna indica]